MFKRLGSIVLLALEATILTLRLLLFECCPQNSWSIQRLLGFAKWHEDLSSLHRWACTGTSCRCRCWLHTAWRCPSTGTSFQQWGPCTAQWRSCQLGPANGDRCVLDIPIMAGFCCWTLSNHTRSLQSLQDRKRLTQTSDRRIASTRSELLTTPM